MEFEYHSFLLRLWVTGKTEDQRHWMASLEWVSTNEKMVFSSIEALKNYLQSITSDISCQDKKGGE
jgi:hypothetical protein